ncbi:MAG: hypothetical protein K2X82_23020 [Gemmataceae bacterium]|nr:hypothetical protein [Gemmataceae bacterium]
MKFVLVCAAAATVTLAGGPTARAQHGHGGHGGHVYGGHGLGHGIGYGHGLGHHSVHHHRHAHGLPFGGYYPTYGLGFPYPYPSSWSYPSYSYPSVVAPVVRPVVAAAPAAVVPAAGVTTSTALRPNAIPAYTGPGVTLRLPAGYPGPVYVQVDKREVEIKPGTEVVLKDKPSYLVEFDRGGEFGTSSSDVTEGVYIFKVADKGWFLVPDDAAAGGVRRNALPGEPKK